MRRKVYRSLDKPANFFGLRGRYKTWMFMGAGLVMVAALFVGSLTASFVGYITFGVSVVALYMYIINFQETVSDRELDKRLDSRRFTSCITRTPGSIRRLWKDFD